MISDSTIAIIEKEYPVCYRCQSGKLLEIHHGVYADKKRFSKWLDMPENLIRLCHSCNGEEGKGIVQSWFYRTCIYSHKLELGYKMDEWLSSIPMKSPDRFIYIGSDKRFKE
jgi:hypothetical protein